MGNSAVDLEAELNSRIETWSKLNVSGADSLKLSDLEARNLFGDGTSDFFEIDKKLLSVKLVDRQNVYEDGCVLDVSDSALTSKLEAVRTQSLPIFVIFPSGKKSNQQSARLGWLADENKAGKYLVLFGDVRPEYNPTAHFSDAMNALYQDQGGRAIIPESAKNKYWLDIVSNSVDENLNEFVVKNKSAPSFVPSVAEFLKVRNDKAYTVLCGSNNSGKSLLLKNMKFRSGYGCYMVGAERFYHLYEISTQKRDPRFYSTIERQFFEGFSQADFNFEKNYIDLGKIIANLKDTKRAQLFELCGELIGCKFSMKSFDQENELSLRFIDMDGQNLSVGSTGTRLLMTMLGLCMDENFHTVLIDEPELGLSPKIQVALADFFSDIGRRKKYFPQLRSVTVATHSHLFLDRRAIDNNFVVKKEPDAIHIDQVKTHQELNALQFNLLGNSLEAMFLPSAFILVEGESDQNYLEDVVHQWFPERNILFIQTHGDPKAKVHLLKQALGDIYKSPFRSRIFVILDATHTPSDPAALVKQGVLQQNIIVWDKNGIEFVYPNEIVCKVFGCSPSQLENMKVTDDEVELNGIKRKKVDLCREVVGMMSHKTKFPPEIANKFINPLGEAIG